MTSERHEIPLPTKFLENRRAYFAGEYDRLLSKIGNFDKTNLRDIMALSICHVHLSQVIEKLAERGSEEVSK